MDGRVTHVIGRMGEQLHTRIALALLAAEVDLSLSRLGYLFRAHTGLSPGAYLHALRMERARLLLETTSLSVRDVMAQVGLSDPSHFSRDFRNAHGLSPRAYRLQLRLAGPPIRYIPRAVDLRAHSPSGPGGATSRGGNTVRNSDDKGE